MKTLEQFRFKSLAAAVIIGLCAVSVSVFAVGPDSGKGKKPRGETAAQNLSVPAIMVGILGTVQCGTEQSQSALVPPTGEPLTGYEVPGYYWIQKVHTWQTQCFNADEAVAFGNWGDNLSGDAKLKVGSPIRVELVLTNMTDYSVTGLNTIPSGTLQGYTVIKLQPSLADRLSAYGHAATGDTSSGWNSTPVDFPQASWVVHNQGITFSVLNLDTGVYAVPPGTNPTAEINATGKIVYGYNLRVSAAGNYRIQFTTTPAVTLTGVDAGDLIDENNVSIDIVVAPGGGGGGKKPR
ncbi:MAG: hypothetical protein E6Q62_01175 [Nitrosomonas sp.]|nr:MAG: hypothetical protein E6Q62_01175 [Nitrosomonas sp.]